MEGVTFQMLMSAAVYRDLPALPSRPPARTDFQLGGSGGKLREP
jgi:hypothetical protein